MNIYLIMVLVSMAIYVVIGNYAGKNINNAEDYFLSGRNASTLVIVGTLIASFQSTVAFLGDSAYAYTGHMNILLIFNITLAFGYVLGPLFFGRYLRRSKALTMSEYFGKRYNKKVQVLSGASSIIIVMVYLVSVTKGTSLLMEMLTGFSSTTAILISFICFVSFTFYSGSKGVILTDTIMFIIFTVATFFTAPVLIKLAGGVDGFIFNLVNSPGVPEGAASYHATLGGNTIFDNVGFAFSIGIMWAFAVAVSPWQASRGMMAKNEHVTMRAGAIAAICTIFFFPLLNIMGAAMSIIKPGIADAESVMIVASMDYVPVIIGAILLTGVMAAGLSSASTFLSIAGFNASNDLMLFENVSDKKKVKISRIAVLVVAMLSLVITLMDLSTIRVIAWFAASGIASSWTIISFGSVWSKKLTARGAYWSMLVGFITCMVLTLLSKTGVFPLPMWLHPFYISIIASGIAAYFGSKGDTVTDSERKYREFLHIIPEEELDLSLHKRTKMFGYVLIGSGFVATTLLIFIWVIPYMNAVV